MATSTLNDEYGVMNSDGDSFVVPKFKLENGCALENATVRYRTYGALNGDRTNALIVCHALTGNAALDSWWGEMLGPGKLFDTGVFFVVCCNVLGSCYGTTGPTCINPSTGKPYGADFPNVTVRDTVRLHMMAVREGMRVRRVACVVGGSMGGMQTLEWALLGGAEFVQSIIVMCCGAQHSAWQIGISEAQRQAIYADPKWQDGNYPPSDPPITGLSVARQMAMLTYRSHAAYLDKFGREEIFYMKAGHGQQRFFEVERYLRYQGTKFPQRFDPLSYVVVTRLMDSHDVGRGRGGVAEALKKLTQPTLVVSVDSDILYPPSEQEMLCRLLPCGQYCVIRSDNGHDGFLLDQEEIDKFARPFMARHSRGFQLPLARDIVLAASSRPWGRIAAPAPPAASL